MEDKKTFQFNELANSLKSAIDSVRKSIAPMLIALPFASPALHHSNYYEPHTAPQQSQNFNDKKEIVKILDEGAEHLAYIQKIIDDNVKFFSASSSLKSLPEEAISQTKLNLDEIYSSIMELVETIHSINIHNSALERELTSIYNKLDSFYQQMLYWKYRKDIDGVLSERVTESQGDVIFTTALSFDEFEKAMLG